LAYLKLVTSNASLYHLGMKIFFKLLSLVFIIFILTLIPYLFFGKVVPPNFIGLRQNYLGIPFLLREGFEEKGLDSGLQWQIPYLSAVHTLPRDFQIVNFNGNTKSNIWDKGDLLVPTTDGSKVLTDITLVIRFFSAPGKTQLKEIPNETGNITVSTEVTAPIVRAVERLHGGPLQLIDAYSLNLQSIIDRFSQIAGNGLRMELSTLSTTDYYDPVKREDAALKAHDLLNDKLAPLGIEIWATLIRRYVYEEKKIEDQIFAKNLQDQMEHLNASLSMLSEAKAETERLRALWDAKILSLDVEGKAKADILESEAKLYESQKIAEGDLLVASAKAEVDSAKRDVLSASTAGADIYVARELAGVISALNGGIVSGIDPFNIDKWVERLLGK